MSFFPKLILIKIRIWFLKLDSSISKFTLKVKTNQQNSEKEEQWWWGRGGAEMSQVISYINTYFKAYVDETVW